MGRQKHLRESDEHESTFRDGKDNLNEIEIQSIHPD
jgi:hypothetical protein